MDRNWEITDGQRARIEDLKRVYIDGLTEPMVLVSAPGEPSPPPAEWVYSPEAMLRIEVDGAKRRLDVGDDYIPQIRVEFGTGQVACAFGCEMYVPEQGLVASKGHVLNDSQEIEGLAMPSLDSGWFGKAYEYTEYYLENKPEWAEMMLLDFQSPFNNAHLVRGNDIFTDFYDCPELVDALLAVNARYYVDLVRHYRKLTGMEDGYIYDWGVAWSGNCRLSNCTLHLVSPGHYGGLIMKHDARVINDLGGGRIHYCGTHDGGMVADFCRIPGMTGLDLDGGHHDLWRLCEIIPEDVTLLIYLTKEIKDRILSGDVPNKRKLILYGGAPSLAEAQNDYRELKYALTGH